MIRCGVRIGNVRRTLADVLPEDLKALRETALNPKTGFNGFNLKEASEALGLQEITLRKYESGEIVPSISVLTAMSDLYNVDFLISALRKHPLAHSKKAKKKVVVELEDA